MRGWGCTGLAGLTWAVATAWAPGVTAAVTGSLPGGGLLRDGQKWLAPLALLLAVCAPAGLDRLTVRWPDRTARTAVALGLVVLPLALMPDAAWGVSGRLGPWTYPAEWAVVREYLAVERAAEGGAGEQGGDVVVLPWSAFRAFEWNDRRTSLDPAPRWLPLPSVVDDTLLVGRPGGTVVEVSGEDPRAAQVARALADGRPLADVLPGLGVGWVLIERGTPGRVDPAVLAGCRPVLAAGSLELWAGPTPAPPPMPSAGRVAAVLVADGLAVLLLLLAVARITIRRRARSSGGGALPPATVATNGSEEGS